MVCHSRYKRGKDGSVYVLDAFNFGLLSVRIEYDGESVWNGEDAMNACILHGLGSANDIAYRRDIETQKL